MAKEKNYKIGADIKARCSKCKDITTHIIQTIIEEKVKMVKCAICSFEHEYRRPRVRKNKSGKSKEEEKNRKLAKAEAEFEIILEGLETDSAIEYDPKISFRPGDVVEHRVFGLGKVLELITPNKMQVHFSVGVKIMVCVIDPKSSW